MSGRPRRGAAAAAAKKEETKKVKEVKPAEPEEEEEEVDDEDVQLIEDDDDGPPPVLEREASCGENEDTDGETKEGDNESADISPNDPKISQLDTGESNLWDALSSMFQTDTGVNKKRISPPTDDPGSIKFLNSTLPLRGKLPKEILFNATPMAAAPATRFTSLRQMNNSAGPSSSSSSGNRKYGVPPPIPRGLRTVAANSAPATGVGSNTSLGPARILENRKRQIDKGLNGFKGPSLVAYNGGRAGEKFQKLTDTLGPSKVPSTSLFDVQSMLRDQSPVKMQVSVGGDLERSNGDSIQEALEFAALQKETIGTIARNASNHSMLLGSMIMNGLNTLQSRNTEEYNNFSGDLFALITKYNIH